MKPARSSAQGSGGSSSSETPSPVASQPSRLERTISLPPRCVTEPGSTCSFVKTTSCMSGRPSSPAASAMAFQRARDVVTRKRALESLRM